jgi:hypothetical protein
MSANNFAFLQKFCFFKKKLYLGESGFSPKGISIMNLRQIVFFGFCMAVVMSMCMSLVMTAVNVGFGPNFLMPWLQGWGTGFLTSLPLSFVLPPLLHSIMRVLKL